MTVEEHTLNHMRKTHENGNDVATFIETNNKKHMDEKPEPGELGALTPMDEAKKDSRRLVTHLKVQLERKFHMCSVPTPWNVQR